ncbi:MAG: nuclear transport factor 2 family protein [Hyphomonadaceae bacterium]|nr:nuclear transport factor 2 family protein [Hyphomonadaceae bacterium]
MAKALDVMHAANAEAAKGNWDGVRAFFHEDLVMYEADSIPYGGAYHGHAGHAELKEKQQQAWANNVIHPITYLGDDNHAVSITRKVAIARATGRPIDVHVTSWWKMRGDKVAEIRVFYEDAGAITAALTP